MTFDGGFWPGSRLSAALPRETGHTTTLDLQIGVMMSAGRSTRQWNSTWPGTNAYAGQTVREDAKIVAQPSANPVRDLLVFLYTIGLVFSALAAYFYLDSRHFVDKASHAAGVVVAVREGRPYEFWTIVAFKTRSGVQVTFESKSPSRVSPPYSMGTGLDVLYNDNDPSNARIYSFVDLWGLEFGFAGIGLVFLAIGCALLLHVSGRSRRSKPNGGW